MPDSTKGPPGKNQNEHPDQRTGEDVRRRGWYWHWNSIITQYAPLIGLKGVGLLNSYTVWTDRREDSPHRGYAFPSQQAESTFYGEDRAELITINKILVALDLIEVRKEMVLHVDEKGRRWRVPHNLYRVKDSASGFNLTVEDVLRVAELAASTPAIYRYIRRIFSANFAPIDAKNPWHEILPAVRQTETWQKLAAKAAREDARASARSKAGHRKRRGKGETTNKTQHGDSKGAQQKDADAAHNLSTTTSVAPANNGETADVQPTNNGSPTNVAESNRASAQKTPTIDDQSNKGGPTVVHASNTTYNQDDSYTTTTTTVDDVEHHQDAESGDPPPRGTGSGPILQASTAVLAAFESANDRPATTLERELLGELERDFADAAQRVERSPAAWVVEAIREAVNSGSRFVAPKRVREILNRWATSEERRLRSSSTASTLDRKGSGRRASRNADEVGTAWRAILTELQTMQIWGDIGDGLAGSVLLGEKQGRVRIGLPDASISDQVQQSIRQEVEPRFSERLGRTITLEFESATESDPDPETEQPQNQPRDVSEVKPPPRFSIVDGLTSTQVWAAAQEELRVRISPANFETWLRPASLIGRDDQHRLVLGVPSQFAQQRVESRLLGEIQAVLSGIVGQPVEVVVVVARQWLREQAE